ncbi:hypothetical protein JCM1841_004884, partial [Sporobolomyces salmonicolor]
MSHLQNSRPRAQPLSLDPNPHLHQLSSAHSGPNTAAPSGRARFLSSLRSAPLPHTQHSYQQQAQPMASPQAAALAQFQQAQTAYLAELQRQIMIQQNQIFLNQQQIEAEAALRAMQVQQQQMDLEREREREREAQAARANPLVASALARRKRQSLNLEAQQRESLAVSLQQQQQQQPPVRQRVSTSPSSASPSASTSTRSTPPPPAVILSAPGEPYPDTSSASGSESGETRPSSPASASEVKPSPKSPVDANDAELKAARRRSHLDTLSSALGSRQKRRPASIGGASDLSTPRPSTVGFSSGPVPHVPSPRSVSDSHASLRSPSFAPAPPGPVLSPFASSFTPTPLSPSVAHEPAYVSSRPPAVPGTASAVRQPRGPPVSVQEKNFGARIRQKAIENLAMRSRTRGSAVQEHAHRTVVVVALDEANDGFLTCFVSSRPLQTMALTPTPRRLPERSVSDGPALTADDLSYADVPRPFKNPHHVRAQTGGAGKRSKSLKQILVMERERVDRVLEGKKRRMDEVGEGAGQGDGTEVDPERGGEGKERERERAREVRLQEAFGEVVSYASVEAPPSLMPQKKYCDVTGLEVRRLPPPPLSTLM